MVAAVAPGSARAEEPADAPTSSGPPPEPEWDAMVFGYGWLSSFKADLSAGPVTVELDERIDELIPLLTWTVAGGFEGRYRRFVLGVSALGEQLQTTERAGAKTFQLDPLGTGFGGLTATRAASSASIRATEVMAEAMGGWRVFFEPASKYFDTKPDDPRRIWFDVLGGARYWYWRTEVRLSIQPVVIQATNPPALPSGLRGRIAERILSRLDLPRSIQVGGSNGVFEATTSWTDAIVGFRVGGDVTRSLAVTFRADIGGFGYGDSSSFTWQVMPGVQWRVTDHWVLSGNWRAIGFSHGIVDEAIFYGALLGVGYRF
jgi:hypothetical protein